MLTEMPVHYCMILYLHLAGAVRSAFLLISRSPCFILIACHFNHSRACIVNSKQVRIWFNHDDMVTEPVHTRPSSPSFAPPRHLRERSWSWGQQRYPSAFVTSSPLEALLRTARSLVGLECISLASPVPRCPKVLESANKSLLQGFMETCIVPLVVLEDATKRPFRRTKRRVERMHIRLFLVCLCLGAVADFELPSLVVCTVGTRHELFVLSLERKPSFEVVLLGCGVIQSPRNDGDNLVGQV